MTQESTKENIFLKRKKRILPAALISAALPFMIFVAVPFDIFCHNVNEFQFSANNFIWLCILFFLAFSIINFAILFLVPKTAYRIISGLLVGTLFMCFMQTNFLNGHINSLGGDELGNGVPVVITVFNIIFWLVAEAGFAVLFACVFNKGFTRGLTIFLSLILLLSQLVGFFSLLLKTDNFQGNTLYSMKEEDADFVPTFLTTKNLTTISTKNNVFVFCIDRMDGKEFAEPALNNHSEIFSELDGFTYFNDATSLYGHTYPSVCYILTQQEYNGELRKDYLNNAYENNQTLSALNKEGYSVNLYTESYYAYYNAYYMPDYIDNLETASLESITFKNNTSPALLALRMSELSLYRCLPYLFKDVAEISTSSVNGEVEYQSEELQNPESSTDMKKLYTEISSTPFTTTEQKMFSFIHLEGCHSVSYDEEWNKASRKDKDDINISIKNSFKIINAYLKKMKELGVYDDATIIITADHGKGSAISDLSPLSVENLSALFVKPSKQSRGENYKSQGLTVSNAKVSHTDLWATIFESENLSGYEEKNKSVFYYDNLSVNDRERKFVWHTWNLTASNSVQYEYLINGSARDFANWNVNKETDLNKYLFD